MAKRRRAEHRAQGIEQGLELRQGETWQQRGVRGQLLGVCVEQIEIGLDHARGCLGGVRTVYRDAPVRGASRATALASETERQADTDIARLARQHP